MGYSRENYKRVKEQFRQMRSRAQAEAVARRLEVEEKFPEIKEIDKALAETATKIMIATAQGADGLAERMDRLKKENLETQAIREDMLESKGYPRDYTHVRYTCDRCQDTGFLDCELCICMRRALTLAGYESSGVGGLMKTQRFDNFSLEYYRGDDYTCMKHNFDICHRFATEFGKAEPKNLFFFGGTGTGKTHLSTAIAKTVIDGGNDVVYETAQNLFRDFEDAQFGKTAQSEDGKVTDRYFSADLLILDDLGAELSNQFTIACLYNLINTRISRGKPTVISTNLNHAELETRYSDRILSRLMGEFVQLPFSGKDIRMEKLRS